MEFKKIIIVLNQGCFECVRRGGDDHCTGLITRGSIRYDIMLKESYIMCRANRSTDDSMHGAVIHDLLSKGETTILKVGSSRTQCLHYHKISIS